MAKFATYYFRYRNEWGGHEWEQRQQHLATLFETNDSIVFGEGVPSNEQQKEGAQYAKVFNHRIYHLKCNPNIIVMQFANSIDVPVENKFEQKIVKNEPSLFVIIDNRKDVRTVAIQNRRKAYSAPRRVAQIMQNIISDHLYHDYCYSVDIFPKYYPVDLFKAWNEQQKHAQALRFYSSEEMGIDEIMQKIEKYKSKDYFDDTLMSQLLQLALEAKKAKYRQQYTVMPEEKTTALYVDKTSIYMKNLITLASATGEPVEIITDDGAVFKCFVETEDENTDKIVHYMFDDALLEMLFKGRNANGDKLETGEIGKLENAVVEMLNSIKYMSEDIEKKEGVA